MVDFQGKLLAIFLVNLVLFSQISFGKKKSKENCQTCKDLVDKFVQVKRNRKKIQLIES
jgi:hypothetical protein